MQKIHSQLKMLRLEKEMSQQQLADAIEVKRHNISDWEQGRTEPDVSTIILLARYFGVTTDFLLGAEQ